MQKALKASFTLDDGSGRLVVNFLYMLYAAQQVVVCRCCRMWCPELLWYTIQSQSWQEIAEELLHAMFVVTYEAGKFEAIDE